MLEAPAGLIAALFSSNQELASWLCTESSRMFLRRVVMMAAFVYLPVGCIESPVKHNGNLYGKYATRSCSVAFLLGTEIRAKGEVSTPRHRFNSRTTYTGPFY